MIRTQNSNNNTTTSTNNNHNKNKWLRSAISSKMKEKIKLQHGLLLSCLSVSRSANYLP